MHPPKETVSTMNATKIYIVFLLFVFLQEYNSIAPVGIGSMPILKKCKGSCPIANLYS